MSPAARLIGVGVGPGDPELMTLKAVRALREADVVAHFAKAGRAGNARAIAAAHMTPGAVELPLRYPVTTEIPTGDPAYAIAIGAFFDASAATVAQHLDGGRTVAVLSEGDPLFYGSYMHLHFRLSHRYPTEVIPGVTSLSGCWSAAGLPLARGDDVLSVVPGTLDADALRGRLAGSDAIAVIKVGRNLAKIREAVADCGRLDGAVYVERGTMTDARILPLAEKTEGGAPYFAVVLVPAREAGAVNGRLAVVGLGPGDPRFLTGEAQAALDEAEALYGYVPYLDRVPARAGQARHASDNREELARAAAALDHAATGGRVAIVSGGDPGVFAMAAAVCEAIETGPEAYRAVDLAIVPGVTAMLAVAARVGAPLGHDFCALSLSDNLKPWAIIERRLAAAAEAGFVIALYNPVSKARPTQLAAAFGILARHLPATTPVVFGRAVGRDGENTAIVDLARAPDEAADMATLIIVGSATTRVVARPGRPSLVYTPRAAMEARG